MGLAPHAHVYMPQMESWRYSKIRDLDIRDPTSAANLVPEERRIQRKAAYRLWSHIIVVP